MFLVFCLFSLQLTAQKATRHYPGSVKYNKTEVPATVFDVPYPVDQVEDGLKNMLKNLSIKVKEKNGFYEATNVNMVQLGNKTVDVYYKVMKDGKNDSKIYAILTEPGQSPETKTSSLNGAALGAGIGGAGLLAVIAPALDEHDYNIVKAKKEDDIRKNEKKLTGLADEQVKLEKKRADLEKDIEKLKQDQINLQSELDTKKASLADFVEKVGKGKKN